MGAEIPGLARSLSIAMITWIASCVVIYLVLTVGLSMAPSFAATLVGAAAVLTLPALIAGLIAGSRRFREQYEFGHPGARHLAARELLVVALCFACASLLAGASIVALEKRAWALAAGAMIAAALMSRVALKRMTYFAERR